MTTYADAREHAANVTNCPARIAYEAARITARDDAAYAAAYNATTRHIDRCDTCQAEAAARAAATSPCGCDTYSRCAAHRQADAARATTAQGALRALHRAYND